MHYLSLTLPGGQQISPPSGVPHGGLTYLQKVIANAFTYFIILAIALTIIYIVLSGIQWAGSSGDKEKIAAARRRMTWAIIGLIIVLVAYGIVNIFGYFFGVKLFG